MSAAALRGHIFDAAGGGDVVALKRWLRKKGARVDFQQQCVSRGIGTCPPIYVATQEGRTECIKALIEARASVDLATTHGDSSLLCSSQFGQEPAARLLIEAGASVNFARPDDGLTPLAMAAHNGHTAIVRLLLENSACSNQSMLDGTRPLHLASRFGRLAAAGLLLRAGAAVNAQDDRDAHEHAHVVTLLLRQDGVDVNHAIKDGLTPLLLAANEGRARVVTALLEAGADRSIRFGGVNALERAQELGHTACVRALTPKPERRCALCDATAAEVDQKVLRKCGCCRMVSYCCKEHQVEHWYAEHKRQCKAMLAAKRAERARRKAEEESEGCDASK